MKLRIAVAPFPLVDAGARSGFISPAALDPAGGLYAVPPNLSALPPVVRMAILAHPHTLQDGAFRGSDVQLVVSPISTPPRSPLILAADVDDEKTIQALRRAAEAGSRIIRVDIEKSDGFPVLPEALARALKSLPADASREGEIRLPEGLLTGLPAGFGGWLRDLYRLPSSLPESPSSYCLVLGQGAAAAVSANVLRHAPAGPPDYTSPQVVARALRVMLHVLEDILVLTEENATALLFELSRLEAEALFGSTPSPLQVCRRVADACGIPPSLASQAYEAAMAVAAAGIPLDEESTRWGMDAKSIFALARDGSRSRETIVLPTAIVSVDLGRRVALDETIYIRASPRTVVSIRSSSMRLVLLFPAVIPDPQALGGDTPAILIVPSDQRFSSLVLEAQRYPNEVLRVRYRATKHHFALLEPATAFHAHALSPLLDTAQDAIERIVGGGWMQRATQTALRVQMVLAPGGEGDGKSRKRSQTRSRKRPQRRARRGNT